MLGGRPDVRLRLAAAASAVAVAVSACSGTPSLTTGSLFSGGKAKQVDPATERALQVAATSARATNCGYNFDPSRLKASYLAYETQQGGSPDQIAKLDRSYDFTVGSVGKRMAAADEYCNDEQTAKIKSDLTRHLAGDFSTSKRAEESGSLFSQSSAKPWDKERTICPSGNCGELR